MTRLGNLVAPLMVTLCLTGTAAYAQSGPTNDDLRALRYYMQNNETKAVEAEIERLQSEFPGWTPSAVTAAPAQQADPGADTADIYARLARGDVAGAQKALDRTRARFPSWSPPADLTTQIALAEAQLSFDRAVDRRDTAGAVRIGSRTPALFRCDRVNNAWNLAELQAASGSADRALAAYTQVVRTCSSVPELVATIEKAETVTSDAQLAALTDTAKSRFPAQTPTFDQLLQRLMAGRGRPTTQVAAAPKQAAPRTTTASRPRTQQPAPRAVAPTQAAAVVAVPNYGGPSLASLPRTGDSRVRQARAAKTAGNFRACMANSARPQSLDIAYERAWCAYNLERSLEALAYFSAAARGNLGGDVPRDSRFGMVLSMLKRGMVDDAAQIAATTDLTTQQRKEVETIILDQRGVNAFQNKQYRDAIDYFDALEQLDGGLRRDLAMLRGYSYLRLGNKTAARDQFQRLHNILATPESRQALTRAE